MRGRNANYVYMSISEMWFSIVTALMWSQSTPLNNKVSVWNPSNIHASLLDTYNLDSITWSSYTFPAYVGW